jgi:succinate-semialdehyde dehydrogenase/glutarate-semialdehyde dehydrogenase
VAATVGGTLIAGEWLEGPGTLAVVNPADGSEIATLGYGGKQEAAAAADAAKAAFPSWSELPGRARADILLEASRAIAGQAERIGSLLMKETGKRLPEAVAEVRFAAEYFRWFAEQIRRPLGEVLSPEFPGRRHVSLRRPAGVAVCLTPWNFPVSIQARKLAPALAAGCTTVSRASEKAPLAVVEMFRCLTDAGLPAGVANLVQGPAGEQTEALLAHRAVRVVSFTGSTEVGRRIMALASERIVRPLLELGGNAPFIVFADADLDAAVEGLMVAKFRNNGQSCIAANRFLVDERVYGDFRDRVHHAVEAMTVGDPSDDPPPDLGPLIDRSRVQAVEKLVAEAEDAGGRRLTGGGPTPGSGSYSAPCLVENVEPSVSLFDEEVFGPAAGIFRFETEAQAIELANRTEMGLAAYFYTHDLRRSWRVAEQLEAGIIGCNSALPSSVYGPMGGMKQSGLGREGSHIGLEEFSDYRYVTWELGAGE